MSATATPALRWSSVRDCPRKAVYEATGAPARERTDREDRILYRGKSIGRDYANFLTARYGADNVECERKVIWPMGVGHIDVYLKPTNSVIEVLSSAHASDDMIRSKLLQAVGYIEHDPDADNGALIILNPSDFTEDRIVLTRTSKVYAELVGEMNDRIAQVTAWRAGGTLPGRVCSKPTDAWGHFCLHAAHCFDGWEPPALPALNDTEAAQLTIRLYEAKKTERELKQQVAVAETARKEIEQKLDPLVDAGVWEVGPYKLVRSDRTRDSFKLTNARKDSRFVPDLLDEFTTTSRFSVWTVDRVAAAESPPTVTAEDFGEEAPW